MAEKINDRIAQSIQIINAAIKTSIRTYIPFDRMKLSIREILQFLFNRYKQSDDEIIKQLFEQLQQLKASLTKSKIESWVAKWKNMKNMIIERNMKSVFESKIICVKKFLKAGRIWAPNFYDNWVQQKRAAKRSIEFFQIIKQFRLTIEESLNHAKSTVKKGQINLVTLQKVFQNQKKSFNQSSNRKNNKRSDDHDSTFVCEKTHLFKLCSYIHISNRSSR